MTRTEIIAYCTAKLGITDSAAQTQAALFLDMRDQMIWNDADWKHARVQQSLAVSAGVQDYALNSTVEFIKVARWNGAYDVPVLNDVTALTKMPTLYDTSGAVVAIVPLARDATGIAQIRIIGVPTQAGTLLIIGKKKWTVLAGSDTPKIPGGDMALCEFVMGDLYEWLRQMDKAATFFAKGGILIEKMKELETAQAGELRQIIPTVQLLDGEDSQYDSYRPLG